MNLYYGAELKFLEQGWLVLVVGCFFFSVFITCPSQDGQVAAEASSGKPLHGVFHYLFYHYNLVFIFLIIAQCVLCKVYFSVILYTSLSLIHHPNQELKSDIYCKT